MRIDYGPGYRVYFMQRGRQQVDAGAGHQESEAHCKRVEGLTLKKETFSRYDTADYLKTEEDVARYMAAVMEAGPDDPAFIAHALGVVARARNMSQLARDAGLTRVGLYKALSREGNPSFSTIMKVARALGFRVSFTLPEGSVAFRSRARPKTKAA